MNARKPTRKSGTKRPGFGQNFSPDILRRACLIMFYIKDGVLFENQIAKRLGISREKLAYWLAKLDTDGLIYCTNPEMNKFKLWKLTPGGETFYVANEGTVTPNKKVSVENARFKCYIRNQNNFLPFLEHKEYGFKKTNALRNNIVYDGRVEGVFTRIIHGARHIDKISMIIISKDFFGNSGHEANYVMYDSILRFQDFVDKKWNLDLSRLELDSEHVEYTWESPFAKALMKKTNGSPVKNNLLSVNRSPPHTLGAEEHKDFNELDRHLLIPEMIDNLKKDVEELQTDNTHTVYKIDQIGKDIISLAEGIKLTADAAKTTGENVANLATKLTELTSLISGKISTDQGKTEQKDFPLNDYTKNIYS